MTIGERKGLHGKWIEREGGTHVIADCKTCFSNDILEKLKGADR